MSFAVEGDYSEAENNKIGNGILQIFKFTNINVLLDNSSVALIAILFYGTFLILVLTGLLFLVIQSKDLKKYFYFKILLTMDKENARSNNKLVKNRHKLASKIAAVWVFLLSTVGMYPMYQVLFYKVFCVRGTCQVQSNVLEVILASLLIALITLLNTYIKAFLVDINPLSQLPFKGRENKVFVFDLFGNFVIPMLSVIKFSDVSSERLTVRWS